MKISCQPWSSVEVTYVHPPQVKVRKIPVAATTCGSTESGRAVRTYQRKTRAKRGPAGLILARVADDGVSLGYTRGHGNEDLED